MATLIGALLLALLAVVNYRFGRSLLWPPTLHAGLWSAALFILFLCGDMFYDISATTVTIYVMGSLAFSAGALLHHRSVLRGRGSPAGQRSIVPAPALEAPVPAAMMWFLRFGLITLILLFIFFWERLQSLTPAQVQIRYIRASGRECSILRTRPVAVNLPSWIVFRWCRPYSP